MKRAGTDIPVITELLESRMLLAAQPVLVRDIYPGLASAAPHELVDVNGTLFFAANNGRHGIELWKSDGTFEGTGRLGDLYPSGRSSHPRELTNVNGTLYFIANNVARDQVWMSDGTTEGTRMVTSVDQFFGSLIELTNVNGTLYVFVNEFDDQSGDSITHLDRLVGNELLDSGIDTFISIAGIRDTLYYTAVSKVRPEFPDGIYNLTAVGEHLFFTSETVNPNYPFDTELWRIDGLHTHFPKTTLVRSGEQGHTELTEFNGTLFFETSDQLWKSDGTASGTVPVTTDFLFPSHLVGGNGTLAFLARDPSSQALSLWKSQGSADSTSQILSFADPRWGPNPSPNDLTVVGDKLFFTVDDGVHGRELWMVPIPFASLGSDGVLHIEGTEGNDHISLFVRGSTLRVWREGEATLTFPLADVKRVEIDAFAGDDAIDWTGITIPTYCFGGSGNDRMTAGTGDDTLSGGVGRDLLNGGGGNDFVSGGGTNDVLFGEAGHDVLVGGAHNDVLYGGAHNDRLLGEAGHDILVAGGGKDTMYGGDGDDQLTGGAGWDLHAGEAGNDRLFARDGRDDEVDGGQGDDAAEVDDPLDVLLGIEAVL